MSLEMYVTCRAIISPLPFTVTGIQGKRTPDFSQDTFRDPNDSTWEPVFLPSDLPFMGDKAKGVPRKHQWFQLSKRVLGLVGSYLPISATLDESLQNIP
jgi:hypothetical protein